MTADDIAAYCDNLKESLLKCLKDKTPIIFQRKEDTEPVPAKSKDRSDWDRTYGVTPMDEQWLGATITILVGRPAQRLIAADEQQKRVLVEGLPSPKE